ncbi:hypothetical protein NW762_013957 [Fusarium torreyae]|uniref:Uncharacterized protein n=1 Tax=Fusarium torreyae TaxID=1237075 RepID=A0A9W8RKS4_9HYPO|nr:hypothetical protein NW762_013957 [Fusarium torreyae]
MPDIIEEIKSQVWVGPGTDLGPEGRKPREKFNYYRKWGFPIYRTYYGKESDEHWQTLLYSLRHQTKLAFGAYEDDEDTNQDDRRQVRDLFDLEVHNDPSQLDGLDVRGLREFCKTEQFKETQVIEIGNKKRRIRARPPEGRAMADYVYDFILLADEAVLGDIARGESVVKAVSLLWTDGQLGWGWLRIPTGSLLDLWNFLTLHDDRTEYCLRFDGPEEDLADYIWPAEAGTEFTCGYSEIRPWRHYSTQIDLETMYSSRRVRKEGSSSPLCYKGGSSPLFGDSD